MEEGNRLFGTDEEIKSYIWNGSIWTLDSTHIAIKEKAKDEVESVRLCQEPRWDAGTWCLCNYAGFSNCTYHDKPLKETRDGWRICCEECKYPHYIGTYDEDGNIKASV